MLVETVQSHLEEKSMFHLEDQMVEMVEKVEVVVSKIPVEKIIDTATKALYTGHIGDGKIFVYNVAKVVKVRTGEQDYAALQDVE